MESLRGKNYKPIWFGLVSGFLILTTLSINVNFRTGYDSTKAANTAFGMSIPVGQDAAELTLAAKSADSTNQVTTLSNNFATNQYSNQGVPTYTITVSADDMNNNPVNGVRVTVAQNGINVVTGYTPLSFSAQSNSTYTVTVPNYYNGMTFDHWNHGSTANPKTITPTHSTTLMAYYAKSTSPTSSQMLYDNFQSPNYSLTDGQTSPNGKWSCVYTGYGSVGVTNGVFAEAPTISTSPGATSAASTLTTSGYKNVHISLDVRTVSQLRQNSPPNPWEVAWLLWSVNTANYNYYFTQKTNGIELGKHDNPTDPLAQVFLYTSSSHPLTVGQWYHWDVYLTNGNHIQVYIDGQLVADVYDTTQSATLSEGGKVGLYTEDASVQFDNVYITSQ